MQKTPYYSFALNSLPKGCALCVQGKKLVLFITGLCSTNCFYCPISEQKKNKDVIYANEWPIEDWKDILEEARLSGARGAGITGGDPLCRLDRTVKMIRFLKSEFNRFHIHLYTPLTLVTESTLKKLFDAGLDEIRFHPDLKSEDWNRITAAKKFEWDVGVEIPLIPGYEGKIRKMADDIHDKIDFLNLNELEYSDTNAQNLGKFGLKVKDEISYGIKGSQEMGLDILKYIEGRYDLKVHLCTAKLKDKVQLAKRLKRRAKNAAKKYDIVTKDGTLVRGAVYLDDTVPGVGYSRKMALLGPKTRELDALKSMLEKKYKIRDIGIDFLKKRVLVRKKDALKINKKIQNTCAIVEEYPTYDQFEVEVEILSK